MVFFERFLYRTSRISVYFGGLFLIVGLLLLVGNIFGRFAHFVIPGSYEIFELIMLVPVACALFYTALDKTHVVVAFLISRLPKKLRQACAVFAEILTLIVWSLMAWAGLQVAIENGFGEMTDVLEVPVVPFRVIWVICLILFSLTSIFHMIKTIRGNEEK